MLAADQGPAGAAQREVQIGAQDPGQDDLDTCAAKQPQHAFRPVIGAPPSMGRPAGKAPRVPKPPAMLPCDRIRVMQCNMAPIAPAFRLSCPITVRLPLPEAGTPTVKVCLLRC